MAMSPKNRAAAVAASRRPVVNEYHVYDPNLSTIDNNPVTVKSDGARTIRLSASQAQYLIDQGAIGLAAESDLSEDSLAARKQFLRRKDDA